MKPPGRRGSRRRRPPAPSPAPNWRRPARRTRTGRGAPRTKRSAARQSLAAEDRLAELLSLPTPHSAVAVPQPRRGTAGTPPDATAAAEAAGPYGAAPAAADGTASPTDSGAGARTDAFGRFTTSVSGSAPLQSVHAPRRAADGPLTVEELDRNAEDLLALLDQSITSAERQLFELRTAAADDARILGALGDGGLLPPGPDVLATVEFLGEHGIPALPGWRYLAQAVDPADHAARARRPARAGRRRRHHRPRSARQGPRSPCRRRAAAPLAVAVGTAAALLAPVPAPGAAPSGRADVFLVPPNPAMHDEHAADEERQALRAQGDRPARGDPRARRPADPVPYARGPPRFLARRLPARDARRAGGGGQEGGRSGRDRRSGARRGPYGPRRGRRGRGRRRARQGRTAGRRPACPPRRRRPRGPRVPPAGARRLAGQGARADRGGRGAGGQGRGLPGACQGGRRGPPRAQRAADDAHRTARTLRAERAEIAGVPETLPEPDQDAPRIALPALREAYRAASQLYEKVGVGADLRAEQARAESEESAALAELNRLSNKVRTRAALMLEGTDGADGPSRQAAVARAESLVQMLESRASAASEQLGRLRGEAERLAPRGRHGAHRTARRARARRRGARAGAPAHCHLRTRLPHRRPGLGPRGHAELLRGTPRGRGRGGRFRRDGGCCCSTCSGTTTRRTRPPRGPTPTRAVWRRPGSPPPSPAVRCAAARPTCPPPRPRCARRATYSYGMPTPRGTSRYAPPRASRSASCRPPRCPSTPPRGRRRSRPGCAY